MTTDIITQEEEQMVNKLQDELIQRLKEGMANRGWSQGDLSRATGVSQPNISHLISANRQGTLRTWNKLLRAVETADAT